MQHSSADSSVQRRAASALELGLPFDQLHGLAELESWRKEIVRPIYHVHKWWANRLGSVFRAIVLAGNLGPDADVWSEYYNPSCRFPDRIVLDPFMGSGTTIGEALKLGCKAVGCDINPVAYFQVRKALEHVDEDSLRGAFRRVEERAAPKIRRFYRSRFHDRNADVLYAFWVMVVPCPACGSRSRLFKRRIFVSHAYPARKPESLAVCPSCGEINTVLYTDRRAVCRSCSTGFDPQEGPSNGRLMRCERCSVEHRIIDVVRRLGKPPEHEMYALSLLLPDGQKVYKRPDELDLLLYQEAAAALARECPPVPHDPIPPGHNTDQARGYNYRFWRDMFNERQLYSLGTLLAEILREPSRKERECLLLLFSGILEFNNMFCSFKGEGTGAVRHLFHHHILKPERTPLEANVWGTPRSSGSFSTLFERRLIAARRYCARPFEIRVRRNGGKTVGEKVYGASQAIRPVIGENFADLASGKADVLLLAGDSGWLPLPDQSVDLVVTDPPYFDNVHYSELADFFFSWLKLGLMSDDPAFRGASTRSEREVQGRNAAQFGALLGEVLSECARVLKPQGSVAFTFHHSRPEAWVALAAALARAGLRVVAAHPIKGEMSVAVPKRQARDPIDLDLIVVCRQSSMVAAVEACEIEDGLGKARQVMSWFNARGIRLSRGDIRVVLMGEFLKIVSAAGCSDGAVAEDSTRATDALCARIEQLYQAQEVARSTDSPRQLSWSFDTPAPQAGPGTPT